MSTADDKSGSEPSRKFSAGFWERQNQEAFLAWRETSGNALKAMTRFRDAIDQTTRFEVSNIPDVNQLALNLSPVLRCCDKLLFNDPSEVIPYATFHLLDRYGRTLQVLEYLFTHGLVPLRKKGINALEVGSGPAPALYATRDFYASLIEWPQRGAVDVKPLRRFHTLERGSAWDHFLHILSEHLLQQNGFDPEQGQLPFARSIHDFENFDVLKRHHDERSDIARQLQNEFESVDDFISPQMARQLAYESQTENPSAYDLIFMCNFLTNSEMTEQFSNELRMLAKSLTKGGILVVMGGTKEQYPKIFADIESIAKEARLHDVSPANSFEANTNSERRTLLANHERRNVNYLLSLCTDEMTRNKATENLPSDVLSYDVPFEMPNFKVAAFVNRI